MIYRCYSIKESIFIACMKFVCESLFIGESFCCHVISCSRRRILGTHVSAGISSLSARTIISQ